MTIQSTQTEQAEQDAPVVRFTEAAQQRVKAFMESNGRQDGALRVAIQGRTSTGFRYAMGIVEAGDRADDDVEFDGGGFRVLVDRAQVDDLRGATVDFVEGPQGSGLQVENPNPVWRDETALAVQQIIETKINPGVASHGGWVELLDVKDDIVYVRLGGGCQGCGMADVTLKQGIETLIKEGVPQITRVVDDTDHAAGTNPYYRPAKG